MIEALRCENGKIHWAIGGLLLFVAISLVGCGDSSGIDRVIVTGKVTLDGKPVENGQIRFYPTGETTGPVAGGSIIDGAYVANSRGGVVVGTNRVGIAAYVPKHPNRPVDPEGMEVMNAAPAKYTGPDSELERTITADTTTMDFELSSK